MKSAEDWLSRLVDLPPKKDWLEMSNTDAVNLIKQIQLDAAKWAMTEAARLAEAHCRLKSKERKKEEDNLGKIALSGESIGAGIVNLAILTRRDSLTVEDMK